MAFSLDQRFWLSSLLLLLLVAIFVSSLSDTVFNSQPHAARSILEAKKSCPVNLEFLNYTVITSKCKGPQYPPKECCAAFKEIACPYVNLLNDATNDCALIMFSYINLYGNYPPGLFSSECREGKQGLVCSALPPSASPHDGTGKINHQKGV
ncbi:GPI-anchored protein LLG1 [Cajanus cajan]|uniref:GPI-anchored protein LORELEI n=1 Tax=Cajanus cajan TaxID=3821 RepID=A0A151SVQ9_CAJCA|nr:GPI-anchored protein LLG1 [Cajanus cajan]KYP58885.1 GPI-anchored protein LORELEI [Cajanus cajan]